LTSNNFLKNVLLVFIVLFTYAFAYNNQHKQVIICFDDGYYSVYKYAFPVLNRYKIPITFALISASLENGNTPREYASGYSFMNRGEIKEMIDSLGIEIASHSVTHRDMTKLSTEEIKYELSKSKRVLDSIFGQEVITFVYPYGAVNSRIVELTKATDYKLGRSIRWGEPNLWVDRYLIPIKEVRMSTSVAEVISHIKYHKTTVLLFHRIAPHPSYFTEWGDDQFKELISILKSDENIDFITLKELYREWWQDITAKYLAKKGWLPERNPILFQKVDVDQTRAFNTSVGQ
jgi:peptidoglycan/xylan/chitin deacetylase (PgdA/CDA1 family)